MKRILQITVTDRIGGNRIEKIYLCDDRLLMTTVDLRDPEIRVCRSTEHRARRETSAADIARMEQMKVEEPDIYAMIQEDNERNKPQVAERFVPEFAYGVIAQQAREQLQHQENADKAARKLAKKASELLFPQLPEWP